MSSGISSPIVVERVTFTSGRGFDDVLERIFEGIGRPDIAEVMAELAKAPDYDRYKAIVQEAAGPSGLIRFMELDQGHAIAADPESQPFRIKRILAGNPVTMSQMVRYVPDAGSTVPVSILVHESRDGVRVSYDTVASVVRPFGDERALAVAENLDRKVLALLQNAT